MRVKVEGTFPHAGQSDADLQHEHDVRIFNSGSGPVLSARALEVSCVPCVSNKGEI